MDVWLVPTLKPTFNSLCFFIFEKACLHRKDFDVQLIVDVRLLYFMVSLPQIHQYTAKNLRLGWFASQFSLIPRP